MENWAYCLVDCDVRNLADVSEEAAAFLGIAEYPI
jgi:hypothetical protein